MAFGLDSGPFWLKEGFLYVGDWDTPELIGTDSTRPEEHFTGDQIGYIKQGTTTINMARTYAEFKAGTPAEMVRKDLVEKTFGIQFELGQFGKELFQLLKGTDSQLDYAVTIPSTETWHIHHIGPDEEVQTPRGYLLKAKLTNDQLIQVAIYYGRVLSEDNNIVLAGTDYAVQAGMVTAFRHPNFVGEGTELRCYGGVFHRAA